MTHEPHDERVLLREFLSGRDVACPACGYNLRNTTADRCAECGQAVTLGIARRPRLGAFVLLAAAIAAPLGFGGTIIAPAWFDLARNAMQYGIHAAPRGWGRPDWVNLGVTSAIAVLLIVGLRLLVVLSPRFLEIRRGRQWILAIGAVMLSSATFIAGLLWFYARVYVWFAGY